MTVGSADGTATSADGSQPSNVGSSVPRLWTPPLVELTPATSYGFDVIDFATHVLGTPLDPWQEWLVVHAGELLADGRPRFRYVLVLVARQNGKTFLCEVLALYWLFVERRALVLGTSTNRDYARRAWLECIERAQQVEDLAAEIPRKGIRTANGSECLTTVDKCEYRIAASTRKGGRSLTIHRLILDELREHQSWDAWNASTKAMNAVRQAQCWSITNQGDDTSIVLDALRAPALGYIARGEGDWRLGLFEWSAPDGSLATDPAALAAANPNFNRDVPHGIDPDALAGEAARAQLAGGEELASFKTEVLCMRVHVLDPAISPERWLAAGVDPAAALQLSGHRGRLALCFDVSLDGMHACAVAAAAVAGEDLADVVHVEVIAAWSSTPQETAATAMRRALPQLVARVRPRAVGWFPYGPAAAVAAALAERRRSASEPRWPPRGVTVEELTAETPAVCMGLAEQVDAGAVRHPRDPMLDAHVKRTSKLHRTDGRWLFERDDVAGAETGPIDGSYALAGAVHLARLLPAPRAPLVGL